MSLLRLNNVTRHFGGVQAVNGVSLAVDGGELLAIIGPNGAGKTTLFNIISHLTPAQAGEVLLRDEAITQWSTHRIAQAGVARTLQTPRPLTDLTVVENVMVGIDVTSKIGWLSAVFRPVQALRQNTVARDKAEALLAEAGLAEYASQMPQKLPFGLQRRLEVVRALATNPSVLLLDEPGAGLSGGELDDLVASIALALRRGIAVLWIEHHLDLVLRTAPRIHVMDYGTTVCEGRPDEILRDERVLKAYIGDGYVTAA